LNFSVITINFNNLDGLIKTVESVLSQSYELIEYIIIDGGSSDGSKEFLIENSQQIDFWVSEKDNGVYHAMNKGLNIAKGDFCIFLNSGDFFYDKFVLEKVNFSLDKNYSLIYGIILWEIHREMWNPMVGYKSYEITKKSEIPHQGCFFNTNELKAIGGYKEEFKIVSDWGAILDLIVLKKQVKKIDLIVSVCEEQGLSAINLQKNKKEHLKYMIKYHPFIWIVGVLFELKKRLKSKTR
jgi:glycosyltransferase involved in cell wall biosynthesis